MTYVALAEALVIALVVWLAHKERRAHDKAVLDILTAEALERAELLNRIQRPELVPVRAGARPVMPEPSRDAAALAKIGTVAKPNGD